MAIVNRKITGWAIRGRPFSPAEFKRSHLKRSGVSYRSYLSHLAKTPPSKWVKR